MQYLSDSYQKLKRKEFAQFIYKTNLNYAAKSKDTVRRETKGQYLRWTYMQNS